MEISFEQQFLPLFGKNKKLDEVIPDEKFDWLLAQAEKELPAFMAFLEANRFKPLPPTFGQNN